MLESSLFVLGFFVGTPINMLCKWYVPTDNAYLTQEVTKEEGDDVVLWKEEEDQDLSRPTIGSNLMETQKEELRNLLENIQCSSLLQM